MASPVPNFSLMWSADKRADVAGQIQYVGRAYNYTRQAGAFLKNAQARLGLRPEITSALQALARADEALYPAVVEIKEADRYAGDSGQGLGFIEDDGLDGLGEQQQAPPLAPPPAGPVGQTAANEGFPWRAAAWSLALFVGVAALAAMFSPIVVAIAALAVAIVAVTDLLIASPTTPGLPSAGAIVADKIGTGIQNATTAIGGTVALLLLIGGVLFLLSRRPK